MNQSFRLRARLAAALVASASLFLAACSSSDAGTANAAGGVGKADVSDVAALGGQAAAHQMSKLYDAAMKDGENEVVLYGPVDAALEEVGLYKRFEERFPGINVKIVTVFGSALDQKITSEKTSGKHYGDIVHTGTSVIDNANDGLLQSFAPVTTQKLPSSVADPKDRFFANQYGAVGFLVNTDMMKASDAPQNWDQLSDPQFKGKIAMTNPSMPGSLSDTIASMLFAKKITVDKLQAIHDNDLLLTGSTDLASQAVITGQRPVAVGIGYSTYLEAKKKGAPVSLIFPFDGPTPMVPTFVGILKTAPHPDAAKLLSTWLFSPEAMKIIPKLGLYGTIPGSPAPSGRPQLEEIDAVDPPSPFSEVAPNFAKTLGILKKIYG